MAGTPRNPAPTWTRRVPGWSFLLFFLSLMALTFLAVEFWNAGEMGMSGYFAGLASVVPLLLVVLAYYARPVWGLSVPLAPEAVASALEASSGKRLVEPVAERTGPFTRCVAVVRFQDPACTLGWSLDRSSSKSAADRPASIVILRPESRDRKALAALRQSLCESLLGKLGPAA